MFPSKSSFFKYLYSEVGRLPGDGGYAQAAKKSPARRAFQPDGEVILCIFSVLYLRVHFGVSFTRGVEF